MADTSGGSAIDGFKSPTPPPSPPSKPSSGSQNTQPPVAQSNAASKPAIPARAPKQPAQPSSQNVTIRTMQQDMESEKKQPTPTRANTSAAPPNPPATSSAEQGGNYPLPPRTADSAGQKPPQPPQPTEQPQRKRGGFLKKIFVTVIVLFVLGGIGAGGYYVATNPELLAFIPFLNQDDDPVAQEEASPAQEVIPSSAKVVMEYRLNTAKSRQEVVELWEDQSAGPTANGNPRLLEITSGNPYTIAQQASVEEVYYVLLEGDPRPYTLIKQNSGIDELLDSQTDVEVIEKEGWHILHPLSTSLYEQALSNGTYADDDPNNQLFTSNQSDTIGLILSGTTIGQVRSGMFGDKLALGHVQGVMLFGNGQGKSIVFSGVSGRVSPDATANINLADQELLSLIPGQITGTRLGSNFAADIFGLEGINPITASQALENPIVRELVSELSSPYAFYRRTGESTANDLGLIIQLPRNLEAPIVLGDPTLEDGLRGLLPLLVSQTNIPELAFQTGEYAGVPLRFVNIGNQNVALDYAIHDEYLLIATSKEGMFELIETALEQNSSIRQSGQFGQLLTSWAPIPQGNDIVLGSLNTEVSTLLPESEGNSPVLGVSLSTNEAGAELSGILFFGGQLEALPEPSVTPTPTPTTQSSPTPASSPTQSPNPTTTPVSEESSPAPDPNPTSDPLIPPDPNSSNR